MTGWSDIGGLLVAYVTAEDSTERYADLTNPTESVTIIG